MRHGLLCILMGLAVVLGCPARPTQPVAKIDASALQQRAGATLLAALASTDQAVQQDAAALLLALPSDVLTAHPILGTQLGDALLAKLSTGESSLATQQWLIDHLAGSDFWTAQSDEAQAAALAWAITQREAERMETREVAAYALLQLGGPEHLVDLVPCLTDAERTVRAIATEAFGKYGSGVEWPTLRRLAEDPNQYVRLRAAKALAQWTVRIGPDLDLEKREAILLKLEKDDDPFVRRMAAQVRGIDRLFHRENYRLHIYTPLLRGAAPPAEGEAWESFRDTALGRFDWSLGHNLPVPQGVAELVFEFLWDEHEELRPDILEAIALMPAPEERGFLQLAWDSGEPALQKRVLELLREILEREGSLDVGIDPILTAITEWDWVETDQVLRDQAIRLVLLLARSQSLSRFDDARVKSWETKLSDLYYSPRASVRITVHQLNPAHPWLSRAGTGRFASDERLRKSLPRLARMLWYDEDARFIDPESGSLSKEPAYPLSADDWEQLWRWGIVPPLAVIDSTIPAEPSGIDALEARRAAAVYLRGSIPMGPLTPKSRMPLDWADPKEAPVSPDPSMHTT